MPKPLGTEEKQAIVRAMERTLSTVGGLIPTLGGRWAEVLTQDVSTEAQVYYINSAGDDGGYGSSDRPFKSLDEVVSRLPAEMRNNVTITLGAGTYTAGMEITQKLLGGSLILNGTRQNFTPAQGLATGTLDASITGQTYPNVVVKTGANWAVDALKGKWLQLTSGALSGVNLPILSNTATTLELGYPGNSALIGASGIAPSILGAGFKFTQIVSIIDVTVTNADLNNRIKLNSALSDASNGSVPSVIFNDIYFNSVGNSNTASIVVKGTPVTMNSCQFGATTGTSGAIAVELQNGAFQPVAFNHCYFDVHANYTNVIHNTNSPLALNYCLLNGAQTGILASHMANGPSISLSGVVQNGVIAGVDLSDTVYNVGVFSIVRNCGIGLNISGGEAVVSPSSGSTSYIQTCAIGVKASSSYNYIDLTGTTISGNTSYGVNVGAIKAASHNTIITSTSTAMSGNTSGDFTLDGATASSIASLRADPDKMIIDLKSFNKLTEN